MIDDPVVDFAERYDLIKFKNPDHDELFRYLFKEHKVKPFLTVRAVKVMS